ncbi:SDR family NAD(P)-dependent oxidoreductase [Nocardiopsis kunsanensis]|uniref:SDR family NAD(P)-dependent oxidoreductase n=1 Tax=Nocardiopsis kunsanensis TaxID=141693 RepID=UPI0003478F3A|nr:SDR family NAD(P)-dependent oxidoreductase [Nocardiopsis kunsanensis]
MNNELRTILELVEAKSISPEEGRRRMAELRSAPAHSVTPAAEGGTEEGDVRRVAVIGLDGRFSGAADPGEFWRDLSGGVCSVREVPAERWDAERYYDPDPAAPGRTNSRWGGFLDSVDSFDPLFFNISGHEAERMDPQQRLFLETAWTALEDAGYATGGTDGLDCGVFAGAPASDYVSDSQRSGIDADAQVLMGNDTAILPARISYLLNLRGPSIALNTACSSSLVAIQLACQAIESGQCEMALAGGVCLFVGPGFYISASKAQMLSPRGLCRTFDEEADGFVPGEGAGVVVLKDLEAALRDGDHVRGVVLAGDTNQDGKTNGITAPSAKAQADVQASTYHRAGISPESISLVEAHGTGTPLGDPIEVDALTRSFRRFTDRAGFCAIGSVKTNIGHTGQAAGVAGLIKVLLALEHETIPPSLHFSKENPRIGFSETPFHVPTEPLPWPRTPGAPRRAALSSFGYSGTNAHLVVEEPPVAPRRTEGAGDQLFLFSAKTREALEARITDMRDLLRGTGAGVHLPDVAFTLHAGRMHFPYRAAVVAGDADELAEALEAELREGVREVPKLGTAEKRRSALKLREELERSARGGERRRVLEEAAGLYERGLTPDPESFFDGSESRVPLPTYPFTRERYRIDQPQADGDGEGKTHETPAEEGPGLVLEDLSDGDGPRYLFRPEGAGFLVDDHVVGGKKILAGMASLELARAAGTLSRGTAADRVENVVWHRPLTADHPEGLEIALTSVEEGTRFDIRDAGAQTPGVSGLLRFGSRPPEEPRADLERHGAGRRLSATECYRRFSEIGFDYGPGFRVLESVHGLGDEVVARLGLPTGLTSDPTRHPLHPALLDGALQAMIGLDPDSGEAATPRVPHTLAEVTVHAPLTAACAVHLVRGTDGGFDARIMDEEGRVLVSLLGLTTVPLPAPQSGERILRFVPELLPLTTIPAREPARATLVLDTDGGHAERLRAEEDGTFVLVTPGRSLRRITEEHFELDPESPEDHARLMDSLPQGSRPERILVFWDLPAAAWEDDPGGLDPDRSFHRLLALCQAFSARARTEPLTVRVACAEGASSPLGAFARTVRSEEPDLYLQAVGLPGGPGDGGAGSVARDVLLGAGSREEPAELRVLRDGTVLCPSFRELPPPGDSAGSDIRSTGFYLITGGAGHAGRILADHLLSLGARVLLTGRSEPSRAFGEELSARSDRRLSYARADAADPVGMARVLAGARAEFGALNGIVHAAGVVRDRLMAAKSAEQADEVIGAKIRGIRVLDRLTESDPLDFVVLCSSLTAAVGNVGQVDYAYANAALDAFAEERELLRERGERQGRTVSVAWPAWAGGMATASDRPEDGPGAWMLGRDEATSLFDEALAFDGPRLSFFKGDPEEIRSVLVAGPSSGEGTVRKEPAGAGPAEDVRGLQEAARSLLARVLAEVLRIPEERISPDEPLDSYGFDSVMVVRLTSRLEKEFGPLAKTLFFEHRSIGELAEYFVRRHPDVLAAKAPSPAVSETSTGTSQAVPPPTGCTATGDSASTAVVPVVSSGENGEIAVIGVSGRYPQAPDLDTFWDNLVHGRDGVTEIPEDRWPLAGFYSPDGRPGTSYSKWGGFLDGIDRFDSLFFNISPKEAEAMDPQERLFLESAWHLLEDAGCPRSRLAGGDTGVFVGVMYGHYQLVEGEDGRAGVSSFASVANRVSYFLDLHGPSLALDTMCSSSLTAIHLACESLRRGECSTAIAGGVNLSPHPRKYLQLSQTGFASSDGRCRSFGADGDGYVPGEGVGALLLKPLDAAVADGDTVHAVIRGSAVNHGGRTNGYTVPNPRSQRAAVTEALRRSGTDPSEVGYVEAHGTGTSLGDPIEIAALDGAFAPGGAQVDTVPIGSVKSSIGHLESAAGIAAVTKVLLQMRHGALVPSLHADRPNPEIDFENSPFQVQREFSPWEPKGEYGRVAGVSSFGAGGANAHVILSDHRGGPDQEEHSEQDGSPQILVLSARTREALAESARRTAERLGRHVTGEPRELLPLLAEDLTGRIGGILGLRSGDLHSDDSLAESGLDEVARARLGAELDAVYGLRGDDLPPAPDTVDELAANLVELHRDALRSFFGVDGGPAPTFRRERPRLADIAHTLQRGREAMQERMAFVARDLATAVRTLTAFAEGSTAPVPVFRGTAPAHPVVSTGADGNGDPATAGPGPLDGQAMEELARLWTVGTDIDWRPLHSGRRRTVSLPGYPFTADRHWISESPAVPQTPSTPRTERSVRTSETPPQPTAPPAPKELLASVRRQVVELAARAIGLDPERMEAPVGLNDYGFDSMSFKDLAGRISDHYGVDFSPALFFERPSPEAIAQWLVEEHGDRLSDTVPVGPPESAGSAGTALSDPSQTFAVHQGQEDEGTEPIAIIGMSGRFPGSPGLDRYWENLRDQRDLVTEIPSERWDWRELDSESLPPEERCPFRWGAFIEGADRFDPLFFGISPAEAEMMDPQQRVLLETVWSTFEDAGYRPSELGGSDIGLFAGIQFNDYQHLMHEAGVLNAQAALGNEHSISVNRISYLLDLHGPSEPVNTACSSSLVAVHRAIRSLRSGESSMAVAGGVALNLSSHSTVAAGMMGLLSSDGRCKTLDSRANGYVKGEGVGTVLLKPLSRALADGDHVHAVIRGTSVNHGGRSASLTSPNPQAQARLLRSAWEEAGVSSDSVGYLELHGTGTELGDPVEINGIKSAFGSGAGPVSCGIGSVKTNIGHLEPASGIAGLLKLVLSIRHRTLPGIVHLDQVNPYVDLEGTPFQIVRETMPWEPFADGRGGRTPLRAGVSSFGFGGVNAHAVVEQHLPPQRREEEQPDDRDLVFVFSAHTEEALEGVLTRFRERAERWEEEGDRPSAGAVAFTLRSGREEMAERLAVVATDLASLRTALGNFLDGADPGAGVYRGRAEASGTEEAKDAPALARAWVRGAEVDWDTVLPLPGVRTPLPTYPFAGRRYWFPEPEHPKHGFPGAEVGRAAGPGNAQGPVPQPGLSGQELVQGVLHNLLVGKLKLEEGELDDDRDLQDFGVDSMLSAMIMQTVQEELDVQLPLTALVDHPTVRSLARYIFEEEFEGRDPEYLAGAAAGQGAAGASARKQGNTLPPEILPINTRGEGQTSFWVHGATGYSTWFQELSDMLGPDYPLYAFQAKGTDGRSMPHSLEEMVDHYVECVRMVQPEGPYVLGGYSFGGLIAMNMARKLSEEGETIRHLVMFDTYPATQEVFDRHVGIYDEDFLQTYLTNYFLKVDRYPERAIRKEDIAHLPASLRVAELAKLAKERGQKRISADDIYFYLSGGLTCSAHSEGIYQQYEMLPYDASPVLFFQATDGFTGRASALYWEPTRILDGYDYLEPWKEIVQDDFRVVELDNDHLNMLENPTLPIAARQIEGVLRQPPALDPERYENFSSAFEAVTEFGAQLLADRLRDAGVLPAAGGSTSREELADHLGVEGPEREGMLHACVDILEREGYLRPDGNRLMATPELDAVERLSEGDAARARAEELAAEHHEAADYLPLLLACQEAIPEVLSGSRPGTDVVFPDGSMELVAEVYKGNLQSEYHNKLVAERVREHVRSFARRFPRSTAHVFEVGAGTGATSAAVLEALSEDTERLRYFYTDIGPAFLRVAEDRFGTEGGFLDFTVYDIEGAPEPQGIEPCSMDVVVASNVLHTTRRVDRTLSQCSALLKTGGVLILNELTDRLDYNTLTFGLTPGWWAFEDERIQGTPLLRASGWKAALQEAGFTDVEFHGVPGLECDEHSQCVIVGLKR